MSANTFFQRAQDVRTTRPMGFIGTFARILGLFLSITGVAEDPQARQVGTSAIPANPDESTAYTATVGGVVCTYTTDAAATQAELGEGLRDAVNSTPGARAKVVASYAAGVLTFTSVWPGIATTIVMAGGAGGGLIGAYTPVTAAASADVVAFGRVVATDGYVTDEGNPKVFVPQTSHFTAQVQSHTFTTGAGAIFHGTVSINGRVYQWGPVVHNADLNTTCTDIATAINTAMPAETVIAASVGGGGGVVTLTAEVEGAEFEAWSDAVAGTAAKAYTTGPTRATSLKRAMVGISVRRLDVENQTVEGDDPAYAANESVEVATKGDGIVQRDTSETWAFGDEVYVSVATATKGRIYNAAGTNRIWLGSDKIRIKRQEPSTSTDGLGAISIDMGA